MKRLAVLAVALGVLVAADLAAASATPLSGVFETTIKGQAPQLNGKWLLSFTPSGAFTVTKQPSDIRLVVGTSIVSGHTIVFRDRAGPLACPAPTVRGSYTWALSGKTLALKIVNDKCQGRPVILAGAPFTKVR